MDNRQVADALEAWADIIEAEGDRPFAARAYRRAAQSVRGYPDPVVLLPDARVVPGVGQSIASHIAEMRGATWPRLDARSNLAPSGMLAAVQGDLHTRTTASDGRHSIEQMASAAARRGYRYLAITDHTQSTRIARGLDAPGMARHLESVRRVSERTEAEIGLCLLAGAEMDIRKDGRLDHPRSLRSLMDVVVCSVHLRHGMDGAAQTRRILAGMAHDHTHVLGHPTTRRAGIRPGLDIDLDALLAAACEQGWAVEANGSPERLDLDAAGLAKAAQAGVPASLASDAHATWELANMRNACREADRAKLEPRQAINTLEPRALETWLASR